MVYKGMYGIVKNEHLLPATSGFTVEGRCREAKTG